MAGAGLHRPRRRRPPARRARLRAARRAVLDRDDPAARAHARRAEGGRLRLLRAPRTHVEPIFLLYEGTLTGPAGEPAIDVELDGVRSRLWRVEGEPPRRARGREPPDRRRPPPLRDRARLPRGGRDRGERLDAVVIVPTEQEGLTIFPTHRIAAETRPLPPLEPTACGDEPARSSRSTRGRAPAFSSASATSSTPSSSPGTRPRFATRRPRTRRGPPSTPARPRPRSCCARRRSSRSPRSPRPAGRCRRRARSSTRSSPPACCFLPLD